MPTEIVYKVGDKVTFPISSDAHLTVTGTIKKITPVLDSEDFDLYVILLVDAGDLGRFFVNQGDVVDSGYLYRPIKAGE
jgi:hypothetical protein